MKKLFIVATAIILCVVMLIPVSAENYDYNGHSLPVMPENTNVEYKYFTIVKASGSYYLYYTDKNGYYDSGTIKMPENTKYKMYDCRNNNTEWLLISTTTGNINMGQTPIWSNYDIKYKNSEEIYFEKTYETKCDGSTCSASDVNQDNICDDCGAMFSVLRNYTPSDFPSGYPAVPSLNMPEANYYLYKVQSSGITYLLVYPSYVTPTYDTSQQNGLLYYSESYGNYRLDTTNNEWVLSSDDSPYTIGGTNNNSVDIYYSSDTIYDQNGDTFFPIPLWMEMDNLTQGEMENNLNPTVVGILMTLMVCGVGCLALLVVLKLFGKRSLISRN